MFNVPEVPGPDAPPPVGSKPVAVIWWFVATLLVLDSLRRGSWPSGAVAVLGLVLSGVVAYALWWRPGIVADDEAVTLRNPLRDITVPWPAVIAVGGRWSLDIRTETRRYTAFASSPQRRRRSRRGDDVPKAAASGLAEELSALWEQRRLVAASGPVRVRWAWGVIVPGVVLLLAAVVLAVLG